jgi:hypothetical protein
MKYLEGLIGGQKTTEVLVSGLLHRSGCFYEGPVGSSSRRKPRRGSAHDTGPCPTSTVGSVACGTKLYVKRSSPLPPTPFPRSVATVSLDIRRANGHGATGSRRAPVRTGLNSLHSSVGRLSQPVPGGLSPVLAKVHNGDRLVVLEGDAGRSIPCDDATEHAIGHRPKLPPLPFTSQPGTMPERPCQPNRSALVPKGRVAIVDLATHGFAQRAARELRQVKRHTSSDRASSGLAARTFKIGPLSHRATEPKHRPKPGFDSGRVWVSLPPERWQRRPDPTIRAVYRLISEGFFSVSAMGESRRSKNSQWRCRCSGISVPSYGVRSTKPRER